MDKQIKTLKLELGRLDKTILENILETAEGVLDVLAHITGCGADPFKTIDDIMAVLADPDAFNEYASACAPSAQDFMRAVALMASICHYAAALCRDTISVNEAICEKFYQALGMFIVSRDARSFLILSD
jgi:hypothetical protein